MIKNKYIFFYIVFYIVFFNFLSFSVMSQYVNSSITDLVRPMYDTAYINKILHVQRVQYCDTHVIREMCCILHDVLHDVPAWQVSQLYLDKNILQIYYKYTISYKFYVQIDCKKVLILVSCMMFPHCMKFSSMIITLCRKVHTRYRGYAAFCMMLCMIFWSCRTTVLSTVLFVNKIYKNISIIIQTMIRYCMKLFLEVMFCMKLFLDVMFCMKFSSMMLCTMLLCKMVVLHRRYAAFCMMLGMIFWSSGTFALSLVRTIKKFHKINKQNVQCMILLMTLLILLSNYYSGQYVENKMVKQTLNKYRKLNKNVQTYAKKLYYSKPPSGTSVLNSMMMTSINKSMQIYNGNGKKNLDVAFQNIPGTLSHINNNSIVDIQI